MTIERPGIAQKWSKSMPLDDQIPFTALGVSRTTRRADFRRRSNRLCAGGYVLLVDEHVRVDVLSQRFGPRLRAWLDLGVMVVFVVPVCVLLVVLGGWLALRSWQLGETSWHPSGPLHWPVLACIPLGFALLGLQALSEVVKRASFLLGRREKASLVEADLPEFFGARATHRGSP
jgi:hypothetical protein